MTTTAYPAPDYKSFTIKRFGPSYGVEDIGREIVREIADKKKVRAQYHPEVALSQAALILEQHEYVSPISDYLLKIKKTESHLDRIALEDRVRILEHFLSCDRPYLHLYRLGACSLLAALLSLLTSMLLGVGIPFHPVFAIVVTPASLGVMVMAFLIKPKKEVGEPHKTRVDW